MPKRRSTSGSQVKWLGEPSGLGVKGERSYDAVSLGGQTFRVGDSVLVDPGLGGKVHWQAKIGEWP